MVPHAWDYRWSSARFHVGLEEHDPLLSTRDLAMKTAFKEIPSSWAMTSALTPSNATRQNAFQVFGSK